MRNNESLNVFLIYYKYQLVKMYSKHIGIIPYELSHTVHFYINFLHYIFFFPGIHRIIIISLDKLVS